MAENADIVFPFDPIMEVLKFNKESGYNYRERRHNDWTENYDYYRDKVQINRLLQRQSVHIPLMKYSIRTLLKDVDDMPVLYFENKDNDKEAEVCQNAHWEEVVRDNNLSLQDIMDKKQVMLYGRSYDQWQVVDGKIKVTIQDPMDILVSRFTDPHNIHSSRFLIHTHIFVPLSSLEKDPGYDQVAVALLKKWYQSQQGLLKAAENEQMLIEKNQKLSDLGVSDVNDPVLGETYVELSLHFVYLDSEEVVGEDGAKVMGEDGKPTKHEEQLFLITEADGMIRLKKERLEEVFGETEDHYWRNHFPYESWADDLERQDWYSDGVGDIIRGSNRILDVFYSQLAENRTMRNFGMNFYDATIEGFTPQTLPPVPFGWYGLPGKPQDVFQKVEIPDLSESLDEIKFIMDIADRATGATSTQQGVEMQRQITLGEVKMALGEAKERVKGMSKFYTPAWERRGTMYLKLLEAAKDKIDPVTVYKKGKSTNNIYSKEISPKHYMTKAGYICKVWSQDEKNRQDTEALEKWNAVKINMPDNPKVDDIYKRKIVEFAGASPEEINEIMAFEEQKKQMQMSMIGNGIETPGMPGDPAVNPPPMQQQPLALPQPA